MAWWSGWFGSKARSRRRHGRGGPPDKAAPSTTALTSVWQLTGFEAHPSAVVIRARRPGDVLPPTAPEPMTGSE
jgi:hypothetical protein